VSENADIALRAFEAFSRNDLEAGLAAIDPDIEWHVTFRVPDLPPDKTVLRGHDEVRRLWASLREVWDEFTLEREEILYDRDDLLVERVRFRGRGSASGVEVDRVIWYVQDLRDARLIRIRPFESRAEALAAAGISA
jgi:ketosteroid isomerase-like protein